MYRTKASINELLKEVRGIFKRRVRFSILEDRLSGFNEVLFMDDVVVPEAIEQNLILSELKKNQIPEVIVTVKSILGNLFFTHLQSHNITLCSLNDWDLYYPPAIRSFLLYTGICSLLHFKYRAYSHYATRGCILDRCKSKTDIKEFLKPGKIKSPFCEECKIKYSQLRLKIKKEIESLNRWVKSDYEEYTKTLCDYKDMKRPAPHASLQNVKRLQQIQLFGGYKIDLYPSRFVYSYLAEKFPNDINELFKYLREHGIHECINIKNEGQTE